MPFPIQDYTKLAIQRHFKRKKLKWDEDYFCEMLNSQSKNDVYWASIALRDCGSAKCISHLKEKLFYHMKDVKCTSLLTIAHIAKHEQTELYGQLLLNPQYREKTYAIWAIKEEADERAIDAVLAYFKKNKSKLKTGKLMNATIVDGLIYLNRYYECNADIQEFFKFIASIWANLSQGERGEIKKNIEIFKNMEA